MWSVENVKQFFLNLIINEWSLGIIAVLCLFWLLKSWSKERVLPVAYSKLGNTCASENAIKTVIIGVCNGMDAIIRSRVGLKMKRGKLIIQLRLKLGTYMSLTDLTSDLQGRLCTTLTEDLGLNNIGKIDILVSGFSGNRCAAHDQFLTECSCEKTPDQGSNI